MNGNDLTSDRLPLFSDARGDLFVAEVGKEIPFDVKRLFFIRNVPAGASRGNHVYLHHEYVVCCAGSCRIRYSDGARATEIVLSAGCGALIPAGTRRTLSDFSADCILAVASDAPYSKNDYYPE